MHPNTRTKGLGIPFLPASPQSINSGGNAQQVFPAQDRSYFFFQNTSANPMRLTVDGSTPSATAGMLIVANGGSYERDTAVPNGPIQVYGMTTGDTFHALQG